MAIIGNELYFYKKKGATEHKVMHCLSGTYLKETTEEIVDAKGQSFFALKIVIPPNKSRLVFLQTKEEQNLWQGRLMAAMGYSNMFTFYDLEKTLG